MPLPYVESTNFIGADLNMLCLAVITYQTTMKKQLSSNIPDAVYNISVFIPANEPNVTSLW